ncbi:MAG: hypothetical protein KF850_25410 [Labilithrix sp.]|nr:hypothetical protein [Labilithrix sp.]
MAGLATVELTADCDACGLEAGVVEVYDAQIPACRFGLPAATRCKLCAAASRGTLDRAPAKPLLEVPANRCPACLDELSQAAIDERRCTRCGARARLEDASAPTRFGALTDLEGALDAWAEREGFPSREALVAATFVERDVAELFVGIQRRERLEVLADPFANMGVRTTGGSARREREPRGPSTTPPATAAIVPPEDAATTTAQAVPTSPSAARAGTTTGDASPVTKRGLGPREPAAPRVALAPRRAGSEGHPLAQTLPDPAYAATDPLAPPLVPPARPATPAPRSAEGARDVALPPPPPSAPPRAIVYPLVSVIAADGEVHPEERALVDRFLEGEGLPPLADHEFCVHHPSEVAHLVPKERREDVVKLMCETASIDGMPDESERRVIRAYATAWHVDDEKLEFWLWGYESMNTSLARQLFLKLRRFVLSARWSDEETKER